MGLELESLPLESREALRLAALFGERFPLPQLAEAGVDSTSLDALFDGGFLVQEGPTEASFASEEIHEAALAGLAWSERRRFSKRVAEVMERHRGDAAAIGQLFLAAQEFARARGHLLKAAENACQANDFRGALALLQSAFEIWPPEEDRDKREEALREMARCAANSGRSDVVESIWRELLETAKAKEDAALQVEAHRALSELAAERSDRVAVRDHLRLAAELSRSLGSPAEEARCWQAYAFAAAMYFLHWKEADRLMEKAREAAERSNDPSLKIRVWADSGIALAAVGKLEAARGLVQRAIDLALEREAAADLVYAYRRMANVDEYSSEYRSYRDLELKVLDQCRQRGDDGVEQSCLACVSYAFFRLGQWKRSLEAIREVVDENGIQGELRGGALVVRGCIEAFRGEEARAEAHFVEGLRILGAAGGIFFRFYVLLGRASLAYFSGREKQARAAFRDLIEFWKLTDDRHDVMLGLLLACSFYADASDQQSLAECIDILNTINGDLDTVETKAALRAALAEDAWMRGMGDAALASFSNAIEGYESRGTPLEIAFVSRRQGIVLGALEKWDESREAFRKARQVARDLGMRPFQERLARDEAQLAGVGKAAVSSPLDQLLTARQREVVRLIGEGLTNKEAAERLKLSPRTVEMHVAGAMERLNCRTRSEAIRKAAEMGLK